MTPFDGRLPPGWTARAYEQMDDTYGIRDSVGTNILDAQVDKLIPLEAHVRYLWKRYVEDGYDG